MLFSIISNELGVPETRSGEFSFKRKYLAISIAQRVGFLAVSYTHLTLPTKLEV